MTPISMTNEELYESMLRRFWKKVNIIEKDSCWEWTAYKDTGGYGKFATFHHGCARAHRISWILTFGQIPDGLCVCHKCDNPGCVNPSHLFLGTTGDNTRDSFQKGRMANRRVTLKKFCKHGHEFTKENTMARSDGGRRCIECVRARYKNRKQSAISLAYAQWMEGE